MFFLFLNVTISVPSIGESYVESDCLLVTKMEPPRTHIRSISKGRTIRGKINRSLPFRARCCIASFSLERSHHPRLLRFDCPWMLDMQARAYRSPRVPERQVPLRVEHVTGCVHFRNRLLVPSRPPNTTDAANIAII